MYANSTKFRSKIVISYLRNFIIPVLDGVVEEDYQVYSGQVTSIDVSYSPFLPIASRNCVNTKSLFLKEISYGGRVLSGQRKVRNLSDLHWECFRGKGNLEIGANSIQSVFKEREFLWFSELRGCTKSLYFASIRVVKMQDLICKQFFFADKRKEKVMQFVNTAVNSFLNFKKKRIEKNRFVSLLHFYFFTIGMCSQ